MSGCGMGCSSGSTTCRQRGLVFRSLNLQPDIRTLQIRPCAMEPCFCNLHAHLAACTWCICAGKKLTCCDMCTHKSHITLYICRKPALLFLYLMIRKAICSTIKAQHVERFLVIPLQCCDDDFAFGRHKRQNCICDAWLDLSCVTTCRTCQVASRSCPVSRKMAPVSASTRSPSTCH